jgi:hypothetical protein
LTTAVSIRRTPHSWRSDRVSFARAKKTAEGIVLIGQWLTEAKARLKHGQWLPWLETEFGWAERTARNFMQVHAAFKSANFADLEIDVSALYLIATLIFCHCSTLVFI